MNNFMKHLKTTLRHKYYVAKSCFKCGLYKQGLLHDLSKFSPIEFLTSVKYYTGKRSPIDVEKELLGYSAAWMNHKNKNKHHWQYWTDFIDGKVIPLIMPPEYFVEMICDWVGAGKAYNEGEWSIDTFKKWYENNKDKMLIHEQNKEFIELLCKYSYDESSLYTLCKSQLYKSQEKNKCI